jgi:hypothetical protein
MSHPLRASSRRQGCRAVVIRDVVRKAIESSQGEEQVNREKGNAVMCTRALHFEGFARTSHLQF